MHGHTYIKDCKNLLVGVVAYGNNETSVTFYHTTQYLIQQEIKLCKEMNLQ